MNVNDIKSAEWGISLKEIGSVVEGNDDINQCIGIIIRTMKGTDPFRPNFGCDMFKFIDLPQRLAAPGLAKEIGDAVKLWEPRIDLRRVSYQIEYDRILFSVDWNLRGGEPTKNSALIDLYFDQYKPIAPPPVPSLPNYVLSTESYEMLLTEDEEIITI